MAESWLLTGRRRRRRPLRRRARSLLPPPPPPPTSAASVSTWARRTRLWRSLSPNRRPLSENAGWKTSKTAEPATRPTSSVLAFSTQPSARRRHGSCCPGVPKPARHRFIGQAALIGRQPASLPAPQSWLRLVFGDKEGCGEAAATAPRARPPRSSFVRLPYPAGVVRARAQPDGRRGGADLRS